jgi:alpha-1,2-mannosyltransferase
MDVTSAEEFLAARRRGSGPLVRTTVALLLIAIWVGLVAPVLPLIGRGGDAASLAIAGRLIAEDRPEALFARSPDRLSVEDPAWEAEAREMGYSWRLYPYLYPPLIAFAATPASLAELPLIRASMLALTLCAAALSVLIAARCWSPELLIPGWMIGAIAGAALSWPFMSQLIALNLQPLVMLAILAAIAAAQAGRAALAGTALALATAVKVTPAALVLYWLATRRYAEAAWFVIASAGLLALGLILAGMPLHLDWIAGMRELGQSIVPPAPNRSLAALLYGAAYGLEPSGEGLPLRPLPAWIAAVCACVGIVGSAFCLWGARRSRHRPAADAAGQIALILVTILATPLAWSHYFLILVPAAMVWTGLVGLTSRSVAVVALLAILISEPVARAAAAAAEPAIPAAFEPIAALVLLALLLRARRRYFRGA